jgi:uncharacterized SAM-binding protein YcdF (DUF218 family)
VSPGAAPATGRRPWDRMGAAAAAAALACFAWLALRGTGLELPLGLGTSGGFVLVVAAAAALGATRLRRAVWGAGVALAALLLVVGLTPVIRGPAHRLVRADPWPRAGVEAVVVLSAWITADGHLTPTAADRLLTGLAIAREHGVAEVVTSRVSRRAPGGDTLTSDADQRTLAALAGPGIRLISVGATADTREEALATARLAGRRGWRRVAVVTSPAHTRRACAAFERVGLEVTCVPAASRTVAWRSLSTVTDRLRAAADVAYEGLATALYRRRGWI